MAGRFTRPPHGGGPSLPVTLVYATLPITKEKQNGTSGMRCTVGLAFGLVLPMTAFAQSSTPIAGAWSLVSLSEDHHGQIARPLGDKPQGQVIYGGHGELSVTLLSGDREKKPGNPLMPVGPGIAYFGTYSVSGDTIVSHVIASTFPNFAGTDQKGTFAVKGDTLTLIREVTGGTEPFTATIEFTRIN